MPNSALFFCVSNALVVKVVARLNANVPCRTEKPSEAVADERLGVDRPTVLEHRAVERQVMRDAVTSEAAEERYRPAIHRPDTDTSMRH